jgi:hypothetical protein
MDRKRLFLGAGFLGSFLLGCLVGGGFVVSRMIPPMANMLTLANLAHDGNEAYVKYRFGSYPVAKAALLQHAGELADPAVTKGVLDSAAAQFELGLTYARLAVAAERAGHTKDATHYMTVATQTLKRPGETVDSTQVRASVEQLDATWDKRLSGLSP